MRRKIYLFAAVVACVLICASSASAWTKAGHMVTGAIAYDTLRLHEPETLKKLLALLRQNPTYDELWAKQLAQLDEAERDRGLCMLAARWADDIRQDPRYDHPDWHYISSYFTPAGQGENLTAPPDPEVNVITAFRANCEAARDGKTAADRAVAVCWVFHLTGDVHQPLHTLSLLTKEYPEGDRGGNRVFIRVKDKADPINLHFFWDDLVIGTEDFREAKNRSIEMRLGQPREKFDQLAKPALPNQFEDWVLESRALAKSEVYRQGELTGRADKDAAPVLPADYIPHVQPIARRQATLSGYRLADVLKKLLE